MIYKKLHNVKFVVEREEVIREGNYALEKAEMNILPLPSVTADEAGKACTNQ